MTIWPIRSRSGSDASVLSIHFLCAAVSATRGSNGPGCGDRGAGSGVGDGRGGIDATVAGVVVGPGPGAQDTAPATDVTMAIANIVLARNGL